MDKDPPIKIEESQYTLEQRLIAELLFEEYHRRCKLLGIDYSECKTLGDLDDILERNNAPQYQ